jgi:hypothetical protein
VRPCRYLAEGYYESEVSRARDPRVISLFFEECNLTWGVGVLPMVLNRGRAFLLVLGLVLPQAIMVNQAAKSAGIVATISPANPIVGVTTVNISGTASAGATVTDTSTFPDGTAHLFFMKADTNGKYVDGPFVLRQLGTFHDVFQDRATGASTNISYAGVGDFSVAVDPSSREVSKGQTVNFSVTFTSVAGFEGSVVPMALHWSDIPGAAAWWADPSVFVPSKLSVSATLIVRTSANTPAGTYGNIVVQGANGSVTHAAPGKLSLKVN